MPVSIKSLFKEQEVGRPMTEVAINLAFSQLFIS